MTRQEKAKEIADLIQATAIEERGILFEEISYQLKVNAQGYTSNLFHHLSYLYQNSIIV